MFRPHADSLSKSSSRSDWFQGRELGESLILRLTLLDQQPNEAVERWSRALALAEPSDVYGAASLTADFGEEMRPYAPELVDSALQRYASRPEVLANPRIRDRFSVLLFDSKSTIDRTGRDR